MTDIRVGFTGTRKGMSTTQLAQLRLLLSQFHVREFHHGAAVGADTEAALLAVSQGLMTHMHRANGDPLGRNRRMVSELDLLIAAPLNDKEELRSGTWATVRYARKARIPIVMLTR